MYDCPFIVFPAKLNSKECCLFSVNLAKLDNFPTLNSFILSLKQMEFWISVLYLLQLQKLCCF